MKNKSKQANHRKEPSKSWLVTLCYHPWHIAVGNMWCLLGPFCPGKPMPQAEPVPRGAPGLPPTLQWEQNPFSFNFRPCLQNNETQGERQHALGTREGKLWKSTLWRHFTPCDALADKGKSLASSAGGCHTLLGAFSARKRPPRVT